MYTLLKNDVISLFIKYMNCLYIWNAMVEYIDFCISYFIGFIYTFVGVWTLNFGPQPVEHMSIIYTFEMHSSVNIYHMFV